MSASTNPSPSFGRKLAALSILVVGVALSMRLIFGSSLPWLVASTGVVSSNPAASPSIPNATSMHGADRAARPIESLRVGDRVLARNPAISETERSTWKEPRWQDWIHLSLEMPLGNATEPSEGTTSGQNPPILQIEMLRPEQWFIDQVGFLVVTSDGKTEPPMPMPLVDWVSTGDSATVGYSPLRPAFRHLVNVQSELNRRQLQISGLSVQLELPEMGAVGTAAVTAIEPIVSIPPGRGQVVTATFSHPPAVAVLEVHLEGESAPLGVTDNHPFWSVDRQEFIPIGNMEIGEQVLTFQGETKRIESKRSRQNPQLVYNLEVDGEHVYFVGDQGILVHNSYQSKADRLRNKSQMDLLRDEALGVAQNARRHVENEIRQDPKLGGILSAARGGDQQTSMVYGSIVESRVNDALRQPQTPRGLVRIHQHLPTSGVLKLGSVGEPFGAFNAPGAYRPRE